MKKVVIIAAVIVFYAALGTAICAAEGYDRWYTDGELNGYFVLETDDADKVNYYLEGVVDCLEKYDSGVIEKYYKGYRVGNYYDAVVGYYSRNSDQRDKPIITVLSEGPVSGAR